MPAFLIIILASVVGVAADFFMKLAGQADKPTDWKWLILGVVLYALTLPCTFLAIKYSKLASFGVIYSLATFLLLVIVGVSYFHEKLNPYEIAGVVMAVASVFLLARFA